MQRAGRASGARIAVIDDDAAVGEYVAELVVDPNVFAEASRYEDRAEYTRVLAGPRYALLRREIVGEPLPVERTSVGDRLLATFGGADPARVSELFLVAVRGLPVAATLVVGAANPRVREIETLAMQTPNVRVVYDATDMRTHYACADFAIAAAGGTCFELAFMGVPALVVVTAANQRRVAEGFSSRGAARSLGDTTGVNEETMRGEISALLNDPAARGEMSSRARAIVDGQGAGRVVAAMLE